VKKWLLLLMIFYSIAGEAQRIRVGSKHFTEGYILSEIVAKILESEGFEVERNYNLGGTLVCFEALRNNEIDIYPEYSGTISAEILRNQSLSYDQLATELEKKYQLSISKPYGFNNTYALVIRKATATELQLRTLSDLKNHPTLKAGISYEFLKRQDGWDFLAQKYSLPQKPMGMEHGLAYQALQQKSIDLTDAYSTDGELSVNELIVLEDDLKFFPAYEATSLYRTSLDARAIKLLTQLEGAITAEEMRIMNAAVLFEEKSFAQVAAEFLSAKNLVRKTKPAATDANDLIQKIGRHMLLTFIGLVLAILVALPLGVLLFWQPRFSNTILYLTGLLQTIPSIALLAVMIPLVGIGIAPAILALFLYALLPILRNTVTGLQSVDPLLKRVADGIGMSRKQKLLWVEFPLALPSVMAGIRTAAVINVGTATLAAFIGAGGLGEYIVTGLALNNTTMILKGALPAAGLALLIELLFEWIERKVTPVHLTRNSDH
jgi:osmoprotectant transport system permease protein